MHMYLSLSIYGRFPRPASTKNAKVDKFCVRIEQLRTLSIENT